MSETPKLFTRKPKKAQSKLSKGNVAKDFSPPSPAPPMPPVPPTPPTPTPATPVKESFARRYKFLWPLLLTVNLTVGAYIFMRTKMKDTSGEGETAVPDAVAATGSAPTAATIYENPASSSTSSHPVTSQVSAIAGQTAIPPVTATHMFTTVIVPEERQRELFKWILEEKRRIKPTDVEEKKRIDADKAILKQYIRAKSIPSF